jgi:hypothetical protein
MNSSIAAHRLRNQGLLKQQDRRQPAAVVAGLGAVQAQEYPFAKWALALRMPDGATDAQVQRAFDRGQILRTHVMRPTWHFVAQADIRWMQELTAPHVHRVMAPYNRRLGLDAELLGRATKILERALRDGQFLTRAELGARLAAAGIEAKTMRLAHIAMHAELECVICSGPRRGKEFTYALVGERAPRAQRLPRDEALGKLALRYFKSHGPATVRDFVWWSGLRAADAKRGLEINKAREELVDGRAYWTVDGDSTRVTRRRTVHLLPIYDEYLIAYRDREAVPHGQSTLDAGPWGNVTFFHALVIDGQIAGTWRTARSDTRYAIDVIPTRRLAEQERRAITVAAARYERFLGVPVTTRIAAPG